MQAAERYVLGELTPAQRDAFEDHYFDCMVCAADLKALAAFADNAREVFRSVPRHEIVAAPQPAPGRGWFWWFRPAYAFAAVAVLLAVIVYQNLVTIPQARRELALNGPQPLPTLSLTTVTRSETTAPEIAVRANSPFGIYIDIPPSDRFTSYSCELRTREGKPKLNIEVSAAQAKDSVQLFVPGGTLGSGQYEVVVVGRSSSADEEIVRRSFVVKNIPEKGGK